MRINYLYELHFGDWSMSYTRGVIKALENHTVVMLDATGKLESDIRKMVLDAPPCDVWHVFSIADKWVRPVILRSDFTHESVLIHNHGGMETGDYEAYLYGPSDTTVLPGAVLRPTVRILCNSHTSVFDFQRSFGWARCEVVGFPVETPPDPGCDRFGIVVPGRLGFGKQTFLAAKILEPFKTEVVFCTGRDLEENKMAEVLKTAGYEVRRCFGDEYFDLLHQSKVGFSSTLADSLNVAVIEMIKCGVSVVVPDLPFFDYLPSKFKYMPYLVAQARRKVRMALSESWELPNLSCFSVASFSNNLRTVLEYYGEEEV